MPVGRVVRAVPDEHADAVGHGLDLVAGRLARHADGDHPIEASGAVCGRGSQHGQADWTACTVSPRSLGSAVLAVARRGVRAGRVGQRARTGSRSRRSRARATSRPPTRSRSSRTCRVAPGSPSSGSGSSGKSKSGDPAVVAKHLDAPVGLTMMPDNTALVGERTTGRIVRVQPMPDQPVRTVRVIPGLSTSGGGGLLDLAISPNYREDNLIFAYITTPKDNRVIAFTLKGPITPVLTGIPRGRTGQHRPDLVRRRRQPARRDRGRGASGPRAQPAQPGRQDPARQRHRTSGTGQSRQGLPRLRVGRARDRRPVHVDRLDTGAADRVRPERGRATRSSR